MNQDSELSNNDEIPEHRFKNGVRGKYAKRNQKEQSQVRVTIDLDLDVYTYFQERAEASGSASYQNQINHELRRIMEADQEISNDYSTLVNDDNFIAAVAARVKAAT